MMEVFKICNTLRCYPTLLRGMLLVVGGLFLIQAGFADEAKYYNITIKVKQITVVNINDADLPATHEKMNFSVSHVSYFDGSNDMTLSNGDCFHRNGSFTTLIPTEVFMGYQSPFIVIDQCYPNNFPQTLLLDGFIGLSPTSSSDCDATAAQDYRVDFSDLDIDLSQVSINSESYTTITLPVFEIGELTYTVELDVKYLKRDVTLIPANPFVCDPSSTVHLQTVTPNCMGYWQYRPLSGGSFEPINNGNFPTSIEAGPGDYQFLYVEEGPEGYEVPACIVGSSITVNLGSLPANHNIHIYQPTVKCGSEHTMIYLNAPQEILNDPGIITWYKDNEALDDQPHPVYKLEVVEDGVYSVKIAYNGCEETFTHTVTSQPVPQFSLSPNPAYVDQGAGVLVNVASGDPGDTYTWNYDYNNPGLNYYIVGTGIFPVTAVNTDGCKSTVELHIYPTGSTAATKIQDPAAGFVSRMGIKDIYEALVDHNNPNLYIQDPKSYNQQDVVKYIAQVKLNYHRTNAKDLAVLNEFSQGFALRVDYSFWDNNSTSQDGHLVITTLSENPVYLATNSYPAGSNVGMSVHDITFYNSVEDANNNIPSNADAHLQDIIENLDIDVELELGIVYIPYFVSTYPVQGLAKSYTAQNNNLKFTWDEHPGAQQYELELAFTEAASADINKTFADKGFSVTTKNNFYEFHPAFPNGYLYARIRAVGEFQDELKTNFIYSDYANYGQAIPVSDGPSNSAIPSFFASGGDDPHWESSMVFAEEGKKKEIVGYYDKSLRNIQTVTHLASENISLYAESKYDHEGRPAVSILPAPVSGVNGINYLPGLNKNINHEDFGKDDFDKLADGTTALSNESGASQYYSSNDPENFKSTFKKADLNVLPDAENYVAMQTQYMLDATGRVASQSGVGEQFKIGSNHETRYFYGFPTATELFRMFGKNVGDVSYYQKNLAVDPNGTQDGYPYGQGSVSYLDMNGRVIATCLSGPSPESVDQLEEYADDIITVDLQHKPGAVRTDANTITTTNVLVNNTPGEVYEFEYEFNPQKNSGSWDYDDNPLTPDYTYCTSCSYKLEITVTNPEGIPVTFSGLKRNGITITAVNGHLEDYIESAEACPANNPYATYNYEFSVPFEDMGNYVVVKKLIVDRGVLEASFSNTETWTTTDPRDHEIQSLEDLQTQFELELGCNSSDPDAECKSQIIKMLGQNLEPPVTIPRDPSTGEPNFTNLPAGLQEKYEDLIEKYCKGNIDEIASKASELQCNSILLQIRQQLMPGGVMFEGDATTNQFSELINDIYGILEANENFTDLLPACTNCTPAEKRTILKDNWVYSSGFPGDLSTYEQGMDDYVAMTLPHREYKFYELCSEPSNSQLLKEMASFDAKLGNGVVTKNLDNNTAVKIGWDDANHKGLINAEGFPVLTGGIVDPFNELAAETDALTNFNTAINEYAFTNDAGNGVKMPLFKYVNPTQDNSGSLSRNEYFKLAFSRMIDGDLLPIPGWNYYPTLNQYLIFTDKQEIDRRIWSNYLGAYQLTKQKSLADWYEHEGATYVDPEDDYVIVNDPRKTAAMGSDPGATLEQMTEEVTEDCLETCKMNGYRFARKLVESTNEFCSSSPFLNLTPEDLYTVVNNITTEYREICPDKCGAAYLNPFGLVTPDDIIYILEEAAFPGGTNVYEALQQTVGTTCADPEDPAAATSGITVILEYINIPPVTKEVEICKENKACKTLFLQALVSAIIDVKNNEVEIAAYNINHVLSTTPCNTSLRVDEDNNGGLEFSTDGKYLILHLKDPGKSPVTYCDIQIELLTLSGFPVTLTGISEIPSMGPLRLPNALSSTMEGFDYSGMGVVIPYIYDDAGDIHELIDPDNTSSLAQRIANTTSRYRYDGNDTFLLNELEQEAMSMDILLGLSIVDSVKFWKYDSILGYYTSFEEDDLMTLHIVSVHDDSLIYEIYYLDDEMYVPNSERMFFDEENSASFFGPSNLGEDLPSGTGGNCTVMQSTFDCGCGRNGWGDMDYERCMVQQNVPGGDPSLCIQVWDYHCWERNSAGTLIYTPKPTWEQCQVFLQEHCGLQCNDHTTFYLYMDIPEGCNPFESCIEITYVEPAFTPIEMPEPNENACSGLATIKAINEKEKQEDGYTKHLQEFLYDGVFDKCKDNLNETFVARFNLNQYHYTLYYYDQAGNLVQTVPPEGVRLLAIDQDGNGTAFTKGKYNGTTNPEHYLETEYYYNTRNQLVKQFMPDAGVTKFWYNNKGQLRFSQNAKQNDDDLYSYTLYDPLGRIGEVGEFDLGNYATDYAQDLPANFTVEDPDVVNSDFPGDLPPGVSLSPTIAYRYCHQVTQTYYDDNHLYFPFELNNLRNRVSASVYFEHKPTQLVPDDQQMTVTAYDYDEVGNVKNLYLKLKTNFVDPSTNVKKADHIYKVHYDYDLVSGKVNTVELSKYTEKLNTQAAGYLLVPSYYYKHRYEYDDDNRITAVYTTRNKNPEECDARYYYFPHGPLARVEYGQDNVQGTDYVYTLQGWLKAINDPNIYKDVYADNSDDNFVSFGSNRFKDLHALTGHDEMYYLLSYYEGDYKSVAVPIAGTSDEVIDSKILEASTNKGVSLYNGNIRFSINRIAQSLHVNQTFDEGWTKQSNATDALTQVMLYRYDQLHRIKSTNTFQQRESEINNPGAGFTAITLNNVYDETYRYDQNGNIKFLTRNAPNPDQASSNYGIASEIDDLIYNYNLAGAPGNQHLVNNQLLSVKDEAEFSDMFPADVDIKTQVSGLNSSDNYEYDPIGNLIIDHKEKIEGETPTDAGITWNVYGKISEIKFSNNKNDLEFLYDASGSRICKISKPKDETNALLAPEHYTYSWYVRDAQGNILMIEDFKPDPVTQNAFELNNEFMIYGSSRIGSIKEVVSTSMQESQRTDNWGMGRRTLGFKSYELTNHLGNVLTTLSDKLSGYSQSGTSLELTADRYLAGIKTAQDYYPFGMLMPSRHYEKQNCISTTTVFEDEFAPCPENEPSSTCSEWYNSFPMGFHPMLLAEWGSLEHTEGNTMRINGISMQQFAEDGEGYVGVAVKEFDVVPGMQYKLNMDVTALTTDAAGAAVIVDKQILQNVDVEEIVESNLAQLRMFSQPTLLEMSFRAVSDKVYCIVGAFHHENADMYAEVDNVVLTSFDSTNLVNDVEESFTTGDEGWYSEFPLTEQYLFSASSDSDYLLYFTPMGTQTLEDGHLKVEDMFEQNNEGENFTGFSVHDFKLNPGTAYRFGVDYDPLGTTSTFTLLFAFYKDDPVGENGELNTVNGFHISVAPGRRGFEFTPQDSNVTVVLYAINAGDDFSYQIDNAVLEALEEIEDPEITLIDSFDFSQNHLSEFLSEFEMGGNTYMLGEAEWQSSEENIKVSFIDDPIYVAGFIRDFETTPGKQYRVSYDYYAAIPEIQGGVYAMNTDLSTEDYNENSLIAHTSELDTTGHQVFEFTAATGHSSVLVGYNRVGNDPEEFMDYYYTFDNFKIEEIDAYVETGVYANDFSTTADSWRTSLLVAEPDSSGFGLNQVGHITWRDTTQDILLTSRNTTYNPNAPEVPPSMAFAMYNVEVQSGIPYTFTARFKEFGPDVLGAGLYVFDKEMMEPYGIGIFETESGVLATTFQNDTGTYQVQFTPDTTMEVVIMAGFLAGSSTYAVVDDIRMGTYASQQEWADAFPVDYDPWRSSVIAEEDNVPKQIGELEWQTDSGRLKVTQTMVDIPGFMTTWAGAGARKVTTMPNKMYRLSIDVLNNEEMPINLAEEAMAGISIYDAEEVEMMGPFRSHAIAEFTLNGFGTYQSSTFRSPPNDIVVIVHVLSDLTQQEEASYFYLKNMSLDLVEESTVYTDCGPSTPNTQIGGSYRFGFNGQERINDVYGEGNVYDLGARFYSSRLGRQFTRDRLESEYPWQSTYAYYANSPISQIDFNGDGDGDGESSEARPISYRFPIQDEYKGNLVNRSCTFANNVSGKFLNQFIDLADELCYEVKGTFTQPVGVTFNNTVRDFNNMGNNIKDYFVNSWNYTANTPWRQQWSDTWTFKSWENSTVFGLNLLLGSKVAVPKTNFGLSATASSRIGFSLTTEEGFLFKGFSIKAPFNIPVQRFGLMSIWKNDAWGLKVGTGSFVNRTFVAIKPKWNPLSVYTQGVIPKGTPIKFGIIGPQGWKYPGGSLQFTIDSKFVINQSTKIIEK